ncbi:MAG: acyltransferase [Tannerellaceae bacterium]|jgi:peptidoglycan/LPS O-acetylase OafA/YrhL|nr:acyltransferase [Tannerellaceae bacterium]
MLIKEETFAIIKEKNNFNFIRFFLAYSVMFNHFSTLTETEPFWLVSGGFRVKGFFVVSGFLVMLSYLRTQGVKAFFRKRFQRIMPAYALTIILCALSGVLISNLPAADYFTSRELYTYIISNILTLNFLHPTLPGVFETNAFQAVNGSLWTIKVEMMLYLTIPLLFHLLVRYKKSIVLIVVYLLSFAYTCTFDYLHDATGSATYEFLKRQFPGQMTYFCSGIILLVYFDTFRKYIRYVFPASILLLILNHYSTLFHIVEPMALSSFILSVAYGFKWLNGIANKAGNFSYGIFLSHFPIIQLFIYLNIDACNQWLSLLAITLLCTAIGVISWKYIEKPCLYKK